MPYIEKARRRAVMASFTNSVPETTGELNFVISDLLWYYFQKNGGKYQQINDVLGVLEGAKLEFYRRVAAPYEDGKIKENGDVYVR